MVAFGHRASDPAGVRTVVVAHTARRSGVVARNWSRPAVVAVPDHSGLNTLSHPFLDSRHRGLQT